MEKTDLQLPKNFDGGDRRHCQTWSATGAPQQTAQHCSGHYHRSGGGRRPGVLHRISGYQRQDHRRRGAFARIARAGRHSAKCRGACCTKARKARMRKPTACCAPICCSRARTTSSTPWPWSAPARAKANPPPSSIWPRSSPRAGSGSWWLIPTCAVRRCTKCCRSPTISV